jgi:probable HAF family extracellular repeat protein
MRKVAFYIILLTLAMFLARSLPAAVAPRYTCVDLNKLPGMTVSSTHPRGISDAGEVVGYAGKVSSSLPSLSRRATPCGPGSPDSGGVTNTAFWVWFFGVPVDYSPGPVENAWQLNPLYIPPGTFPDPNDPYWLEGTSRRKHWWVGIWQEAASPYYFHAFLYNGGNGGGSGTVWELGTLGGSQSWANGVNDTPQVVGRSLTSSGNQHAFLYTSSGGIQDLNSLAQNLPPGVILAEATGINNAGMVVGQASGARGTAFLYDGEYHDLGTLKSPYNANSYAYAINTTGQVVGYSSDSSGNSHAFLYSNDIMNDLGALPGGLICQALALNDAGQVVGYSASATDTRAFLYSGGIMYDLNGLVNNLPAGVVLTAAYGINNGGQVIADGGIGGYSNHGYLLTPCKAAPAVDLLLLQ